MIKKLTINVVTAFFLLIFNGVAYAQQPSLMSIKTIPAPEGNWVYLPEGDGQMVIHVSTAYSNTFKVWRVPTGTQQWENRILICNEKGNKFDWTCVWRYTKDDTIHDHFVVEASGEGGSIKGSINVTRRHDENHPQ
ncbi:hypothetical protein QFZ77_007504 [Paenibacillus sp. V4I3]|uniref:hypothetical protein n=1 Tax=Paenibacillus sp. V4I3 TaxID=3042305 RepID=UPI0027841AD3|nr:hypothetical protein [Paenibacillus sp. V4I3]MDQ0878845.1 hypothetical protein [Paenibacillus sp. V4I3]